MKKKIIIAAVLVLAILLIPVPCRLKDGGSTEYIAVLYTVTDVHRIVSPEKYEDGITVEILGKEIYNKVK